MINNFNFKKVAISNILNRKQEAEIKADNNFKLAFNNENFKNAYLQARSLQYDIAKSDYEKKDTSILKYNLNKTLIVLQKELKELKLKPSDLKPNYFCKKCNDTGFINGLECECLINEKNNVILKFNNLDKDELPNFNNVDYCVYKSNIKNEIKDIFNLSKNFINKPSTQKLNLIIFGNTGVGKTYLSECILSDALMLNLSPIFITSYNLGEIFLNYHLAKVEEKNEIISPFITCDLLIIDDLGSERILNNVTRECLYIIISERSRKKLKTVITTNLSPDAIMEVYDERIFSRIINKRESILIKMDGDDLRLKK